MILSSVEIKVPAHSTFFFYPSIISRSLWCWKGKTRAAETCLPGLAQQVEKLPSELKPKGTSLFSKGYFFDFCDEVFSEFLKLSDH